MPRPGTDILIVEGAVPGGPILDTGQAFFAGTTERGPSDRALKVASPKQFEAKYGSRAGGSLLYDAATAFFAEGGQTLHVARMTAADADSATVAFGSMTASANSPGTWGNQVAVAAQAATAPATGVVLSVSYEGAEVERSPAVGTATVAAAWSENSNYVRLAKGADDVVPTAGTTVTLAGGGNGAPAAGDLATALGLFEHGLGPGQVAAPGMTSDDAHDALRAHSTALRRVVLLDLPDTDDELALAGAAGQGYGPDGRFASNWAPWIVYQSAAAGATITVPYSGVQAGIIARSDATGGNPNQPAAGVNGISQYALDLSQQFDDDTRERLNDAAVNLAKVIYGQVRTYGYRSGAGADDPTWLWFANSRVVMAVAWEAEAVAENYVFQQIDGRRQVIARFEAALRGVCLGYYNAGALYGETPQEAFNVDTGSTVNTDETLADGELHATIYLRCSPSPEWVQVDIVKVAPDRTLPGAPVAAAGTLAAA